MIAIPDLYDGSEAVFWLPSGPHRKYGGGYLGFGRTLKRAEASFFVPLTVSSSWIVNV